MGSFVSIADMVSLVLVFPLASLTSSEASSESCVGISSAAPSAKVERGC